MNVDTIILKSNNDPHSVNSISYKAELQSFTYRVHIMGFIFKTGKTILIENSVAEFVTKNLSKNG